MNEQNIFIVLIDNEYDGGYYKVVNQLFFTSIEDANLYIKNYTEYDYGDYTIIKLNEYKIKEA